MLLKEMNVCLKHVRSFLNPSDKKPFFDYISFYLVQFNPDNLMECDLYFCGFFLDLGISVIWVNEEMSF
jgi:hypothetical protein